MSGGGLVTDHLLREVAHVGEVLPSPVASELCAMVLPPSEVAGWKATATGYI